MKRYLILGLLAAGACASVAGIIGSGPRVAPKARPAAKPSSGTRHLSPAERAELRRQLLEFNSRYKKRP